MQIPKFVQPHVDAAFPEHVCLVGTCMPDGHAQITPRGSVQVFDDDHISFWDRGGGSTAMGLKDGVKITIYFHNPALMPARTSRRYPTALRTARSSGDYRPKLSRRRLHSRKMRRIVRWAIPAL